MRLRRDAALYAPPPPCRPSVGRATVLPTSGRGGQGKDWRARRFSSPALERLYTDSLHVGALFKDGSLILTSFTPFDTHADEERCE